MKENTSQPIRVLEVFGKMNRGGAETMMMNLYRKMDRSRVQLDFMVHTEEHCQFDDEIEQLGGRIFRVPRFKVYNLLSYVKAWRCFFKAHPEIRVVHGHIGSTAAIYLHEANRARCYTIAHSHSAGMPQRTMHDYFYACFSWPTRFVAKKLLGCSTEAGIVRYGKKAVGSVRYQNFPNAIDLERFSYNKEVREQYRRKLGVLANQKVIVHVGRITTPKNPSMVYRVFKKIIDLDASALCLWVGTGDQEEKYRKLVTEAGLRDRIQMTGARSDIPELLMAADVFLFPSLWEGLPVSVIEAQASGLPCIISDSISKEVAVTPLVEWHSLTETVDVWAKRCIEAAALNMEHRESPLDFLSKAGYDIDDSVKKIIQIYCIAK